MNISSIQVPLSIAKGIAKDLESISNVSIEKEIPASAKFGNVVDSKLFEGTRGYYEIIVYQINTSYDLHCYDACAVLIRKLVELLIEDIYESSGRVNEILTADKQLFGLARLITTLTEDSHWKLNRHVEKGLNYIKEQGDKSAHNRRYNARKPDIDKIQAYLRDISEELLYLANLNK